MLTGLSSFLCETRSHTGSRYADPAECARGEKNTRADDAARVRPPRVSALRLGCPPRPFGCTFINTSFPTSHRCLCPLSFFFDCFVFRAFSGKIRDACVLSEPAPARLPCTLPNSFRAFPNRSAPTRRFPSLLPRRPASFSPRASSLASRTLPECTVAVTDPRLTFLVLPRPFSSFSPFSPFSSFSSFVAQVGAARADTSEARASGSRGHIIDFDSTNGHSSIRWETRLVQNGLEPTK